MSDFEGRQQPSDPEHAPESSQSKPTEESQKPLLALPSAQDVTPTLDISGGNGTVKLDALGPMVVNVDGTLSRIANWDKMAEIEQKNALRILGKRNKERLAALRAAEAEAEVKKDGEDK